MKERQIDILSEAVIQHANAVCVTTNGIVKNDGRLVMGAGLAKDFRDTIQDIDYDLGDLIQRHGNHVQLAYTTIGHSNGETHIVSFPVKHHWKEAADFHLIERSAHELVAMTDKRKWKSVYLPRHGCGNGRCRWDVVKQIIEPILDDRFTVCYL